MNGGANRSMVHASQSRAFRFDPCQQIAFRCEPAHPDRGHARSTGDQWSRTRRELPRRGRRAAGTAPRKRPFSPETHTSSQLDGLSWRRRATTSATVSPGRARATEGMKCDPTVSRRMAGGIARRPPAGTHPSCLAVLRTPNPCQVDPNQDAAQPKSTLDRTRAALRILHESQSPSGIHSLGIVRRCAGAALIQVKRRKPARA